MKIPKEIEGKIRAKGGIGGLIENLPPEENMRKAEKLFNALGDAIRIKILFLLSSQELCVCIIKEICGTSDSKLSYHLNVLKDAKLIQCKEHGNWMIYSLTKTGKKVIRLMKNIMEHFE